MQNWTPGIAATNSGQGCPPTANFRGSIVFRGTLSGAHCRHLRRARLQTLPQGRRRGHYAANGRHVSIRLNNANNRSGGMPIGLAKPRFLPEQAAFSDPPVPGLAAKNLGRYRRTTRAGERRRESMLVAIRLPVAGCPQFRHCRGIPASSREL